MQGTNRFVLVMGSLFIFVSGCASRATDGSLVEERSSAASYKLNGIEFTNASGTLRTYSDNAKVSFKPHKIANAAFFQSLGTNGRACIHCHLPDEGWTITPAIVQYRFNHPLDIGNPDCLVDPMTCPAEPDSSKWGTDPIFRLVDGANAPNADVSTYQKRQSAYSLLLSKALIRVGLPVPPNAEFSLSAVDDPYGFASASELSLFRRPLPTANLRTSAKKKAQDPPIPTLTGVMWDGRETLPGHDIIFDLMDQANGATLGHAQATAGLTTAQRESIVDFETDLHTAQITGTVVGALDGNLGNGGPDWLAANQTFYVGINDVLTGDSLTHAPFTPDVFTIYASWDATKADARGAVARGQALFNRKPIAIRGVGGLNDALGIETIPGTCTTCHDSPNLGHHSVPLPINIGVADAARRTPDLPLYTLTNNLTGATVQTTDPGRALITGKWADIGKFKGPILRGLPSRAPYFHNGMAATVTDVIDFYDTRFGIGFTAAEKADLAAFLLTL